MQTKTFAFLCLFIALAHGYYQGDSHGHSSYGYHRSHGHTGSGYHGHQHGHSGGSAQAAGTHEHHHYYYGPVHNHVTGDRGQHGEHRHEEEGRAPWPPRTTGHQHQGGHSWTSPRPSPQPTPSYKQPDSQCEDKVWTFMVGDNYGGWEYINTSGYIQGLHIDLIQAVCKQAGKECYYILDTYTNCWTTSGGMETPGQGLLDRWYDGCVGLFPSPERLNSFNFSLPFSPNSKAALHYREGALPENPRNLSGRTIGFIDGWAVGKNCLSRQFGLSGNQPGDYEAVMYDTHERMVVGLQMGEVDAVMTVDVFDSQALRLLGMIPVEPWFSCTTAGSSMMARYGSPVIPWWNEAFEALVESGAYDELCAQAKINHGHRGKLLCLGDS